MNSRRTIILTADGNPLVELNAQNITDDGNGVITIEVDTLETPVTIGTGNVQLRDNSSVLEFSIDGGNNWDIVPANDEVIHHNVSAEISTITEKASPVGADLVLIEDSDASNAKKRVQITNLPGGADSDAIHDNVSAEISAITEKVSPVGADLVLIEDSAASNAKKKVQITNLPGGADSDAIHDNVSAEISAVTEKASPVGADLVLIEDSEASNTKKRVQLTNLPTGADSDAIHDNVSAEIFAVTEKASPVNADLVLIEDSEASNAKKRVQVGNLPGGSGTDDDAIHDNVSAEISIVTEKATPVGADLILIEDSAASNTKKRVQLSNLPADPNAIHDNVSAEISTVTEKASPVAADLLLIEDSEASNAKKRIQITNLPTGSDTDAIHDNVSAEISAVTEKASPVGADVLLIEDSEASNAKKRVQITNLPGGADSDAIHDNVTGEITAVTEKTTPVNADVILIEDSEASNAKKRVQIGNILNSSVPITFDDQDNAPSAETDAIKLYSIGTVTVPSHIEILVHSNTGDGGTTFTDSSQNTWTISGNDTIDHSTDQQKFGTSAIDTRAGHLSIAYNVDWHPVGADFTMDMWIYPTAYPASVAYIFGQGSSTGFGLYIYSDGKLAFGSLTVWEEASSAGIITLNSWQHIAVTRNGDLYTIYKNGTSVGSGSHSGSLANPTSALGIGQNPGNSSTTRFSGYIDEVRYSRNVEWSTTFVVPTTSYYASVPQRLEYKKANDSIVSLDNIIHDDTSAEISAVTEKTTPIGADVLLIEDSEASDAKKKIQIANLPTAPINTTITGTTYQPTALQCADLTIFCKTGSNTIELTDPSTGNPGSVKVYALDTQTVTVSATAFNEAGSTGTQYQNNDTAYEWAWFIFEHAADQWIVFQENGTWSLTTP